MALYSTGLSSSNHIVFFLRLSDSAFYHLGFASAADNRDSRYSDFSMRSVFLTQKPRDGQLSTGAGVMAVLQHVCRHPGSFCLAPVCVALFLSAPWSEGAAPAPVIASSSK